MGYLYTCVASGVLVAFVLRRFVKLTDVAYWQRVRIVAWLPASARAQLEASLERVAPRWFARYAPLDALDWDAAARAGMTSSLFDIEANIRDGDPRAGLDEAGLASVHQLMHEHRIVRSVADQTFDEARLRRHRALLVQNNIDPQTGLPLDAKAVTRL